ncbi:acyl-CoA thioesterase [Pseudoalteromonas aurantia]|uniref:Acyl-CoA thioesterase n=1 Tax=Pseudoalteromonas aurantia TaxID=43654 RepID=A0A5S3VAW3_9GAMM|nr:acyl-CoA thioesterase [Pseudoalteromonas aurantia]TMO68915.1 acyl-CoA thioesterase [Pseudoalteromonas aurantia]TMO71943.1 acyl-CoA thioesterase [Pseudoalteromonas aurantia]
MTDINKEDVIAKRIDESITSITKTVFPGRTNHHNTLFGGDALAWMDEAAFIAATRFCRKPLVTISSDRVDFKEAIPAGTFAELVSKVVHVGNTSLKVEVKIYLERMHKDDKHLAISGSFTFVAVDDNHRPTPVVCDKMLHGFK